MLKRSFNLTITFNPGDIVRINGFVDMNFHRNSSDDVWRIKDGGMKVSNL